MHMHIGIRPSVGSLATNIQGRTSALATQTQRRIASLVKKAKTVMVFDLSANWIRNAIPPVAVLAGAAAFGFWQDSIGAGVFACFSLFLLAGIYKALRQIVVTLRGEPDRMIVANARNFEMSTEAIEHLLPWVKDETALTEETAKAYCSVLLDTLAASHPEFAQ
jgi:hypothetical protein